jgi:hypothetical protein
LLENCTLAYILGTPPERTDVATQRDLVPGDITVSVVPDGFMVGRILPPSGPGLWWQLTTKMRSMRAAISEARRSAVADGARAWFQLGANEYQLIPLDDSEFTPD